MDNRFFEQPILNSPYEYPSRHWELDEDDQPTQQIVDSRRSVRFITPIAVKVINHLGDEVMKVFRG